MKKTIVLSLSVFAMAVWGGEFVFDPAKWTVQGGSREGVKAEATQDGSLVVTLPAAATNRIQLAYRFGNAPLKLPDYPCLEVRLEASAGLDGGEFFLTNPGIPHSGGHVGISGAYKARNPNWWSHQRDSLIGCFHPARQQVIVHMVNPREKIPAKKEVTIRRELVKVANATTNRTIALCYLRIPPNKTGVEQTIVFSSIKVLEEVPDDDEWLTAAKAAEAERVAPTSDYSDSSHMLQPPTDHRFAEPFAVVKDGVAVAEIVLAPETANLPILKTAADELQKWLKAITGVTIPVRCDGEFSRGLGGVNVLSVPSNGLNRIMLGKRLVPSYRNSRWFANDGWNDILARLSGRDGFAIRRDPGNPSHLHVFGVKDKGTMNGVFALLENNTDIIWARPDERLGTVYTMRTGDFSFVWGDEVVDIPDGMTRGWNNYSGRQWMARNRCNIFNGGGGGDVEWTYPEKAKWGVDSVRHLGGHNIFHFLKGETDPTLFAHNDKGERTGGQPCWSNPRTFKIFVSNVLNCARMQIEGPGRLYINLQDSWMSCLCSECRSAFRAPDGTWMEPTDENFYSTRYYMFMNKVAAALAEEMPEKGIVTLAYFGSLPEPACELHPALSVEWAPYPQQDIKRPLFNPSNRLHFQHLLDWHQALPPERIDVYGYWGLYFAQYRPTADVLKHDIRLLNKWTHGCSSEVREWREGDVAWDMSGVEFWTITRLYWNPYVDPVKLRKYYIRRTYREAADAVERFYGTIRAAYFADPRPDGLGGGNPGRVDMRWLESHCDLGVLKRHLDDALAKVKHPQAAVLTARLAARFDADCVAMEKAKAKKAKAAPKRTGKADKPATASPKPIVSVNGGLVTVGGPGVSPAAIEQALLAQRKTLAPTSVVLQASGLAAAPVDAIRGVRRVVEVLRAHWPEVPVVLRRCEPAGAPSVNEELRYLADGVRVSWEEAGVASGSRPPACAYDAVPSGWLDFRLAPKRREILSNSDGRYDAVLLGDSITHLWEERGKDVQREFLGEFKIFNAGFSGDRTQNILWACRDGGMLDGYRTKAVALMIGTNNRHDSPEDIAEGIRRIVAAIREKQPQAKVILFNIFPRGEKPNDPGRLRAAKVNEIIRTFADGARVVYVPLWEEFLEPSGMISKSVMTDFLHPSVEGYAIWARSLRSQLLACR